MRYLLDPRAFNVLLIVLNLAAACRWSWAGEWAKASYWCAAAALNISVTLGAVK